MHWKVEKKEKNVSTNASCGRAYISFERDLFFWYVQSTAMHHLCTTRLIMSNIPSITLRAVSAVNSACVIIYNFWTPLVIPNETVCLYMTDSFWCFIVFWRIRSSRWNRSEKTYINMEKKGTRTMSLHNSPWNIRISNVPSRHRSVVRSLKLLKRNFYN